MFPKRERDQSVRQRNENTFWWIVVLLQFGSFCPCLVVAQEEGEKMYELNFNSSDKIEQFN